MSEMEAIYKYQSDLERRIAILERKTNTVSKAELVKNINGLFSNISSIDSIYIKAVDMPGFKIIIVYNETNLEPVYDILELKRDELQNKFPNTWFKFQYIHINDAEVRDRDTSQADLIVSK